VSDAPIILSHSQLKSFTMCRRRWWLAWHLGWTLKSEVPTGVVHIGSHIHLALEGWYGYGLDPLQVLRWSYADVIAQQPGHAEQLRKDLDLAEAMVDGFMSWAAAEGIDQGLEVIATEHEVSHEVNLPGAAGQQVIFRAKLDQLVRRESDHRLLFRDWKTVGGLEKSAALLLDQQMRFYALLQGLVHRDPRDRADGALYVMLRRSKRTARATGPFYQQLEVTYNRHDLNSTYLRAVSVADGIMRTKQLLAGADGKFFADHRYACPPNPTDFCTWGCQFFRICAMFDDGSRVDAALAAEYVQADPYKYYDTSRIQRAVTALSPVQQ
jgi:hypothetical protein